ncbi:MAG: putative quinol monooxygenase [Bacteroidota bacterium]
MIRIVQLTFQPAYTENFLNHFDRVKEQINAFPGCRGMQLLRDEENPSVFFTYSEWKSEADLENYRKSALFRGIWPEVKPWFAKKAKAWSTDALFNGFDYKKASKKA